jgi:hypothetical protein
VAANHPDHLHPVPAPANELSVRDRFIEWLLSDHPAAKHERARRRLRNQWTDAEMLHRLRGWVDKIERRLAAGERVSDPVRELYELTASRTLPRAEERLAYELARVETPEWLEFERHRFQDGQWDLDLEYRYPDHYRGKAAANVPMPPYPGHRAHEPELHAALGERAADALAAEHHPDAWMRTDAVSSRAKEAAERASERRQPEAQTRTSTTGRAHEELPLTLPGARVRPRMRPHDRGDRGRGR